MRQTTSTKILAIWDYEGKLEAKGWDADLLRQVIKARINLPGGGHETRINDLPEQVCIPALSFELALIVPDGHDFV